MPKNQSKGYFVDVSPSRQRVAIDTRARELIAIHGEQAHGIARDFARGGRPYGTRKDAFWSKVANRIATLAGREIGLTEVEPFIQRG